MWLLYNILLTLLAPVWVPWMVWRVWKRKEKPVWAERFGNYASVPKKTDRPRVWVHTVSVGEFVAAQPVLREIRKIAPNYEIVVSVTTSSGHQTARNGPEGLFDHLVYMPMDVARFQLSALQRVRPDVVMVFETELWMNFLWASQVFDARTYLVNGRISDKNFRLSRHLKFFYGALFRFVNHCLMQTEVDAERIASLGAKRVTALGNCKFDQALEGITAVSSEFSESFHLDGGKITIVIGSTRGESEEQLVLEALGLVGFDRLNVIHAPRHLERVPELTRLVKEKTGGVALRSEKQIGPYMILDTYGELSRVYALADIVIIGGGFSNLGGQNIIQPLAHGKPVLHGPHMQNFRDVVTMALNAKASIQCDSAETLAKTILNLIEYSELRESMGAAAIQLVSENAGASERITKFIFS